MGVSGSAGSLWDEAALRRTSLTKIGDCPMSSSVLSMVWVTTMYVSSGPALLVPCCGERFIFGWCCRGSADADRRRKATATAVLSIDGLGCDMAYDKPMACGRSCPLCKQARAVSV